GRHRPRAARRRGPPPHQHLLGGPSLHELHLPRRLHGPAPRRPPHLLPPGRLFVVARKHLGADDRKRTAIYEITGTLEGGPLAIMEHGELPSAGDTSYAGMATIDDTHALLTWYSGNIMLDERWVTGIFDITDIWQGTLDFSKL